MDFDAPHRRYNPLTGEWVLVSPHRARRPWLGQVEKVPPEELPAYDPGCYLCPGNERAGGRSNPGYSGTFVFENDFPALLRPEDASGFARPDPLQEDPLFTARPEYGITRVVCFSPRHDLTLPELSLAQVEAVVRTWADQSEELARHPFISYIQVFENKGAMMGASNPHPHSQIWATSDLPNEPAKELVRQAEYRRHHGSCLLCDYLSAERNKHQRIVAENRQFTALVPFWAVWPFEILVIAHRHTGSLPELSPEEVSGLADIFRQVTARYDNLFEVSFPYSMGFHQAPVRLLGGPGAPADREAWHLHAHFYPPLLRSATVRKFMVGFEMLGMPQRDLTAETAAERLRNLSGKHYRHAQI